MNTYARRYKSVAIWFGVAILCLSLIFNAFSFLVAYPYYKIEIGMSEDQVVKIFGESYPLVDRAERPSLCAMNVWHGDCQSARVSGATYFLTFKVYFDTYAIIGFKDKKVTYKEMGDA